MKRIVLILFAGLAAAASAFSQPAPAQKPAAGGKPVPPAWANFERYAPANAALTKAPKAVFLGDSITDNWGKWDPEFFTSHNFAARGIGGQTTSEMLVRMRQDVIALKPKYMVLLAGINDLAMNNGPIEIDHIMGNIESIVELAKLHKIKPVLCLIFPTKGFGWRKFLPDPTDRIKELNGKISDYAKKHRIPLVEYFADIDKSSGTLPKELSKDSIHPNMDGYKIMEAEILKYLK